LPALSVVVVHRTVAPSLICTVAATSLMLDVPVKVGVPLTVAAASGVEIATVATLSTVIDNGAEAAEVTAATVALAVIVWVPTMRLAVGVIDQLPAPSATAVGANAVAPSYNVTVAPAGATPVNVGFKLLVMLSVFDVPLSVSAVMSGSDGGTTVGTVMLTVCGTVGLTLPAGSTPDTLKERLPTARLDDGVKVHAPEALAVTVPIDTPASKIVTTDNGSAVPVNVGVCVAVGEVIAGNVTADDVSTTTVNVDDVVDTLPAKSVTVEVNVWLVPVSEPVNTPVVNVQLPAASTVAGTPANPSTEIETAEPISAAPAKFNVVFLVRLSEFAVPVSDAAIRSGALASGAAVSIVNDNVADEADGDPPLKPAVAVIEWAPTASGVAGWKLYVPPALAVVVPSNVVPS
jgi:hypothetical protein